MQAGSEVHGWLRLAVPLLQQPATQATRNCAVLAADAASNSRSGEGAGTAAVDGAAASVPITALRLGAQAYSPVAQAYCPSSESAVESSFCGTVQQQQHGHLTARAAFVRALFVFDYRDSDMLHILEDTLRCHNAIELGIAPATAPPPATVAPSSPAAAAALQQQHDQGPQPPSCSQLQGPETQPTDSLLLRSVHGSSKCDGTPANNSTSPAVQEAAASRSHGGNFFLLSQDGASASGCCPSATPRSVQKQPSGSGGVGADGATPRRLQARFELAPSSEAGNSSSNDDASDEGTQNEWDDRLEAALARYSHVDLDVRLVQVWVW